MLVVVLHAPHCVTSARIIIVVVAIDAYNTPTEQCGGALEGVGSLRTSLS